jgi:hypothetical protein
VKIKIRKKYRSIVKNIKRKYLDLTDHVDRITARSLDIKDCESVCLALGPYRNLTTLTAATLFLHPNCQVLNHAGNRIFGNRHVDFLSDYSEERLDHFIQFAIKISGKGRGGYVGGSITHSHAFDSAHEMKNEFRKTGLALKKEKIKCLFWKEPLITSNMVREKNVDLGRIFQKSDRLLFLMPIRNPMDCAISNLKTGHVDQFRTLNGDSSVYEVMQAIMDEIYWFASQKKKYPGRFFYYFEHSITREMLTDLATFLKLDPNEVWLSNAMSVMISKSNYEHDSALLSFYRKIVMNKFAHFPVLSEQLLKFS